MRGPGAVVHASYELLAPLDAGRLGPLHRARKRSTGQEVAIRVVRALPADPAATPEEKADRLLRSMTAWAELAHPHIVRLLDFGRWDDDAVFAVFQHVSGPTLADLLRREGARTRRETVHLLAQILDALGCAHARGIVHGNLGAQDVVVARTGARRNAMVLDFGFAALVPRGEPSPAGDLRAWARLLVECASGRPAPDGGALPRWLADSAAGPLLRRLLETSPGPAGVSIEELSTALARLESIQAPAWSSARGERRQLSIVCCRFVLPGADRDAEDVDEALGALEAAATAVAVRNGGRSAGMMGDRLLLLFGHPQAHEDDARRAARSALAVVEAVANLNRDAGVCVGVHTGLVVVPDRLALADPLVGLAPQIAAGIEAMARPGDVLVSVETQRLLRGAIDAEPAGRFTLPPSIALPVFRLRTAAEPVASDVRETPLVGRGHELDVLRSVWTGAEEGQPAAVVVRGEAGVGKSRLVRELARTAGAGTVLVCRTLPETQDTPLRPLVDLLGRIDEPLEPLLQRLRFDLAEAMPVFTALLARPADPRFPAPVLSAERQKERTLDALLTLILRMSETHPLLLVIEDLQWADPTTLQLVDLLIQEVRSARIVGEAHRRLCALFTARPEFTPKSTDDVTLLQLPRLSASEAAEMVRRGVAQQLHEGVLDDVVRRADGIPLFVEELTRVLAERLASGGGPGPEIPATLRDLLTARLDGVSRGARETAQLAAVIGREFRYDVLHAASGKRDWEVREDVRELVRAGLVLQRPTARTETYLIRHALIRDAAYESLLTAKRRKLHRRVAETLRDRFPELADRSPETLAHHLEHGGVVEGALGYLQLAGGRALQQASYVEARAIVEKALALLATLPESPGLQRREVELLSILGLAVISLETHSAPEAERIYRRAWNVCAVLGTDVPLDVVFGLWGGYLSRSDPEGIVALQPLLERIARDSDDPGALLIAHACLGLSAYWVGRWEESRRHFDRARALSEAEPRRRLSETYGYGVIVNCLAFRMSALWFLGLPELASEARAELEALTERVRDPYTKAIAFGVIMSLAHESDPPDSELALAERLRALAVEQRLPLWEAMAGVGRGCALLRRGEHEEAIPLIDGGTMFIRVCGIMCSYSYNLLYRANAYLRTGRLDEARAAVDEGLGLCATLLARMHEPDLLRLRAEIAQRTDGDDAAEPDLVLAVARARENGSRFHETRAATGLARLRRRQGRTAEARVLLADALRGFAPAADAPYLREARDLLAELG